jgi:hypothetical protein
VCAAIVVTSWLPAQAQQPGQSRTPSSAPVLVTSQVLKNSLERISRGSALWRDAIDAVRQVGRRVLVVTPGDVQTAELNLYTARHAFDSGSLAEAVPLFRQDLQIPLVVVVVNLRLVERFHQERLSVPRDFDADLDRIVVHEVYGHAIPYLLAGNLSGRCADPKPRERASDACSIRRENAVRAELGLGRRTDEGLFSLAFAWARPSRRVGLD